LINPEAGLTRVEQEQVMRSRNPAQMNLRSQVLEEAAAAAQLEDEDLDQSSAAAASRAPPATSAGSRSNFTEQAEPPNYSLEIQHVFFIYGPYAQQVTPFFGDAWQLQCQSDYATGRNTVLNVRQQLASEGSSGINPNVHPQLRIGSVGGSSVNSSSEQPFLAVVLPFFTQMRSEARDTNFLNARRDEISELQNALRTFAPASGQDPSGVTIETYNQWRDRYIVLLNTRVRLPSAVESEAAAASASIQRPSDTGTSEAPRQRQRHSSPPRTIIPERAMNLAIQELQSRFNIRECGDDGECTFKVLHCIEFVLGANRRALHGCNSEDESSQTRSRISNWMRRNANTAIIHLSDGAAMTVQAAAVGDPAAVHSSLEDYCDWIAQPRACGGENEIASFAAMYAEITMIIIYAASLRVIIMQVQHQNKQTHRCALPEWCA